VRVATDNVVRQGSGLKAILRFHRKPRVRCEVELVGNLELFGSFEIPGNATGNPPQVEDQDL